MPNDFVSKEWNQSLLFDMSAMLPEQPGDPLIVYTYPSFVHRLQE